MIVQFNFWNVVSVIFVSSLAIFISREIAGFLHALLRKVYDSASMKLDIFHSIINKTNEKNNHYKRNDIGFVDRDRSSTK